MTLKRILADGIFSLHALIVAIIAFGWLVPSMWNFYMATLVVTLISELAFGYCFLSKWEFGLRKRIDPTLNYSYSFSSYYTYKLTHQRLSETFIVNCAIFFLVASIIINLYFRFPL